MENNIKADSNALIELKAEPATDIDSMISDDIEVSDASLKKDGIEPGCIPLPSGRALSLQETYDVMASENTALVVLVGPSGCGKTTIEATLYQMFQRGKVSNYAFAGSKTIQGYEDRSFYTRINSKQNIATTPRTNLGSQELFLHLRLFDDNKKRKFNYLFADLSGEDIHANMANTESIVQHIPFLKFADSLAVILDGERLADKHQRNGVIEEVFTMIRTIFDAGLYTASTKVQLVISKYDKFKLTDECSTSHFIELKVQELSSLIQNYIEIVTLHKVAAMPKDKSFDVGFGLNDLLLAWAYAPSYLHTDTQYNVSYPLKSEFNKLFYKLAGTSHE